MTRQLLRSLRPLAWSLLLLASGTAQASPRSAQDHVAAGQAPEVKLRGVDLQRLERQLDVRQRDFLHPGDPHDLIGVEEGDNGFRERTPLLVGADHSDVLVDVEENYRRRLAIYEERASFHAPLPRAVGNTTTRVPDRPAPPPTSEEAAPSSGGGFSFPLVLWLALATLAGTLGWKYRYHLLP